MDPSDIIEKGVVILIALLMLVAVLAAFWPKHR